MSAPTVTDRSACTAARHGNDSAYRQGCRCDDAREDKRIYRKRLREGRHKPKLVDGAGTARRLQALGAIGWPSTELGARLGVSRIAVQQWRGGRRQVNARTATRVAQLYDQLSGTGGPSDYTRTRARSFGWSPPLLWHGVNIDDPTAKPDEDAPVKTPRVDLGEVEHLRGGRLSMDEIAKQLRVNVESIERAEYRARQRGTPEAIASYWSAIAAGQTPAQAEAAASASVPVGWRRLQRPENDDEELAVPERDRAEDRSDVQGRVCA